LSKSRFNATLRDGQAVRLPVDAFRSEAIHQVRKRGCAVSGDNLNTERVTDKLQIKLEKQNNPTFDSHHMGSLARQEPAAAVGVQGSSTGAIEVSTPVLN